MVARTMRILAVAIGAGGVGALPPAPARADATLTMNVVMPRASSFFVGVYQPWKDAVERESQGRIKVDELISHYLPLERINDGFELMKSGQAIRSVVVF